MAGSTPVYNLAYFDFGDKLDTPINVRKEIDRFVLIDKQLYGLYAVFGNGVISGWTVEDNGFSTQTGISLRVTPGLGIIRSLAAETIYPFVINSLPPNTIFSVYAILKGSTVRDREIDFVPSFTELGDFAIKIATIETDAQSVLSIDNSDRDLIGFENFIRDEINKHRHRGTPSKIDLAEETRNQLPGARVADFDASKIKTGVLSLGRMPLLEHDDLKYSGSISHAGLDSFVQTLSETNRQLLGEIDGSNQLKQIIFQKYKYPDVDREMINLLAFIPGISPDSFVDWEATTAYVDKNNLCISGKPPHTGEFLDVVYKGVTAFENAHNSVHTSLTSEGYVQISRDDDAVQTIENFENVPDRNVRIANFRGSTEVVATSVDVRSEDADLLRSEGFYSGIFTSETTLRALYTKSFTQSRDWRNYNEIVFEVKCLAETHGAVYAYFEGWDAQQNKEVRSDPVLLLSENEVTTATVVGNNGFAVKAYSIANEVRGCVDRVVVFTDDTTSGFRFFLDNIRVRNTSLFEETATIKLRYSGGAPAVFYSLMYDVELPEGTDIRFRIKAASSPGLLSRAQYTNALSSGAVIAMPGTDAEIDITLLSDSTRTLTPTLKEVTLRLLVDSENHGFIIDNQSEWSLGTAKNITIEEAALTDRIIISDPVNVGGLVFSNKNAISEIDESDDGVFGFAGPRLPISARQAYNWRSAPYRKFDNPVSVYRTIEKTYIIADRDNDRVIECDTVGNFLRGAATSNIVDENNFFVLAACYSPVLKRLTLVASQDIDRSSLNLTQISLVLGSTELPLSASDTIATNAKSKRILEIALSSDKVLQLQGRTDRVWVRFHSGAFAQPITVPATAEGLYGVNGLPVFIGELTYTDFIRRPVHVQLLENGNWLVCNALVGPAIEDKPTTSETSQTYSAPPIIEFNPETPDVIDFSYGEIAFSDFSLGGAVEYSDNLYAVAGIYASEQATTQDSDDVQGGGFVTVTATLEYAVNGSATNAFKVEVGDAAGEYGVKEKSTGEVIVASGTAASSSSIGNYFIRFQGEEGKTYVVTWKITPSEDSEAIFETKEVVGGNGALTLEKMAAVDALKGYRGKVVIIDRERSQAVFVYESPDGLYPSDVDVDSEGNLLIAESDFIGSGGRVVKVNTDGIITWKLAGGSFGVLRDARFRDNGNIVLSM